ncbi:hypothetical protein [Polaromonas sp. CG9_12]|nr:hypothetical protein [Polaromonas sp. CG9_12]
MVPDLLASARLSPRITTLPRRVCKCYLGVTAMSRQRPH